MMAVPGVGKCLALLVLVLIIYTGCAFRIRDTQQSTSNIEQSRTSACHGAIVHGKCTADASTKTGSLPAGTRIKFDGGTDGIRGHTASKIHKPPVVDRTSEETITDDDEFDEEDIEISSFSSSVKRDKRTTEQDRKIKFGRFVSKIKEDVVEEEEEEEEENGSEADVITEEIDEDSVAIDDDDDDDEDVEEIDADEDDDGVEISNGDLSEEDSEEVIDADDDDDEDDKVSEENSDADDEEQSGEERKIDQDKEDDESDDENDEDDSDTKKSGKKVGALKGTLRKRDTDDVDSADNELSKQRKDVVDKRAKGIGDLRKIDDSKKKSSVKKVEDDEDDDDDDDDDDVDDGKATPKVTATPTIPPRKLEKVRLADKDKAKSVVPVQTVTPVSSEPAIESKVGKKATDEGRTRKKENIEESAKATKIETEKVKSATSAKPVTNLKTEPSKTSKDASLKSETSKSTIITKNVEAAKDKKVSVDKAKDDKAAGKKLEKPSVKPPAGVSKSSKKADGSGVKDRVKPKKRTDGPISLTELNDAILRTPTFVINFTAVENPLCQQHGKIFLRQLRGYKLWALQMLDSSAKIPSGLLRGNVNQLGDFDQCLGITARVKVDEKTVKVQGKYCLATFDIHASLPDTRVPVNFMQSRGLIRSSMRDPGHFIPRFTTANWAMCIPAACSAEDARNAIQSALSHVNMTSGLRFTVDVNPEMCYVRQKSQTYTKETIGVLYFYAMIICLVLVATVRDCIVESQGKGNYSERIIMSFSLRRTLKILTKDENTSAGEISCIHGIRSLATIALYVAHKMIPASQIPYANRISLTEVANNPISSLLRASVAYTDCFLLLSGLLTAFNMARESTKRGEIRWFCRFVARFIRLTPALLVMVFWYAYVMEHTGSGPQWNRVIATNAELCKQNSWTNILYIQNFFPFEEMCATHTHQLALDMQLSLMAPMLVFFLTFKPIIGILVVFFILLVSATVRYFATTNNYLSLVIFHGISMKHLYKTANLTYALPLHRATPYVFGVGLGVLLHYIGKNIRIYKIFVIFGWLTAIIMGSWCLFSPWRTARRDYIYDVEEAAHYSVIGPVVWSLTLCWVIFACFTNHGGIVDKFLSSYWMLLFSRISYAVYLCQFAIFFYNVGTTRYGSEFQVHRLIDPYEALVVTLVSIVLTLFIDIPMQEVKNVIMESTDILAMPVNEEKVKAEPKESSPREEIALIFPKDPHILNEEEEAIDESRWIHRDDVVNGPGRPDDSEDDGSMERWRRRSTSEQRRSYVQRETYEDEEDVEESYDEEAQDEEDEEDARENWKWAKRAGSGISVADDGLVERGRSVQRGSEIQMIRQSHRYERDEDPRRERRSLSRQAERVTRRDESPRSSTKRERSLSRASEPRMFQSDTRSSTPGKYLSRQEPRSASLQRDHERTTSSFETRRGDPSPMRDRSASRTSVPRTMEVQDLPRKFSRSESKDSFSARERDRTTPLREISRHERSPSRAPVSTRRDPVALISSGSEEELHKNVPQHQESRSSVVPRKQMNEPKISDEEDWEQELRIRRRKFMERLASEDRDTKNEEANDGWNSIKRRSSAEGKLALLKDPTGSNVMDSWTISRGPRVSLLGSSQETEDDTSFQQSLKDRRSLQREGSSREETRSDEEVGQIRRRSFTSGSQVTSLEEEEEEEEDVSNDDFVLKKTSTRITVMDLSKLSDHEESSKEGMDDDKEKMEDKPIMATLKLFKRESIVKSQASEEDPEYLLPERPKLMEQEQDHPFKKAWQLQKSRSEEDPTAYSLKEVKTSQDPAKNRNATSIKDKNDSKDPGSKKSSSGGPQSTILESYHDESTDTTIVWLNRSVDIDDARSSTKSTNDDSSKLEWPSEDELVDRHEPRPRRESDGVNHEWQLEET